MHKFLTIPLLTVLAGAAAGAGIVQNGSFEELDSKGFPKHWQFSRKNTERAESRVTLNSTDSPGAPDGRRAVEFRNPVSIVNDVYGSLFQDVKVEPGKRYRLNFYLKGSGVSQFQLIMGQNWGVRWIVPTGSIRPDEWKLFSREFTAEAKHVGPDGTWMLRFNIEGMARLGMIDRVSLVPLEGEVEEGETAAAPAAVITRMPATDNIDTFAADIVFSGLERPETWEAVLTVADSAGKSIEFPLRGLRPIAAGNRLLLNVILPLDIAPGPCSAAVKVDGRTLGKTEFVKQPSRGPAEVAEQAGRLTRAAERFAGLETRLARAAEGRPESGCLALYEKVIPQQIALQQKDIARRFGSTPERDYYLGRGRIAIPEIEQALDEFEQLVKEAEHGKFPAGTWKFTSGPVTYRNGFPFAELTAENGERAKRPLFFGGFGHFQQVIDDMPFLSAIGSNVIQLEIGPWHLFREPGRTKELEPDFAYFHSYLENAMKLAQENNIRIALLTSTHYVPEWYRKKYKDAAAGHLFMPLDPLHPKTRELHKAFLDALLPKLAASPYRGVLQSIVLSNEPTYGQCTLRRSFSRAEFRKYLMKKYGSVAGFNRATGCGYRDFDALAADEYQPAVLMAFNRFRQHALAEWHKFLAAEVRRKLPEVPLQAKMMIMQTFAERELGIGYDPELFTEFSDLNGNDNSSFCWLDPAIGTDLQFSLKPVSVNNTENHYIHDGEENPVDPAHIYTSVFQQYMHGASNLVGWVWADNVFGGAPWLDGCIQRRPGCIIAHQKAILDANRLGPEIVAFNLAEAEVAMLYSPSSLILNRAPYCRDVYDLYRDLAGSGHKIAFLSEKQLAEKKFRKVKVLVAGNVRNLRRDAAAGLEAFVRRGGTVLVSGENFTQDEFGRPLESRFRTERLPATNRRAVLTEKLARLAPPPVTVEIAGAVDPLDVVQIRSVRLPDGRILVNLVNFDRVMHEAAIPLPPGRQARELISGEPVAGRFRLPHKKPMLIEIR